MTWLPAWTWTFTSGATLQIFEYVYLHSYFHMGNLPWTVSQFVLSNDTHINMIFKNLLFKINK